LAQEIAIGVLPLILAGTSTILVFVLMMSALANPMEYRHGQIKAQRLNMDRLSPWDDAASGYLTTWLLCLIQAGIFIIATYTIYQAGYYDGVGTNPLRIAFLVLSCGLFVFYFQGLKENFGGGPLALFTLLHWLIPILVAILIFAVDHSLHGIAIPLAALSPLSMIPLSIIMLIPGNELEEAMASMHHGLGLGLIVLTALNIWLHARLRKIRKATVISI
jgi:hypothetical protein